MPRKTVPAQRRRTKKTIKPQPEQYSTKWFRWGESYSSFMMGIIVVIIAFLFVGSLAKLRHTQQITATSTVDTTAVTKALDETQGNQATKLSTPSQKEYTVHEGDDLWSIAEKMYNNGYNWVDIAKANKLENPDVLFAGAKLTIPQVTPVAQMQEAIETPTPTTTQPGQTSTPTSDDAIKGNTYTVQAGDSLWDIAVRAYADGYKWVEIAKANHLSNPGLIFSGNVLQLPR